MLSRRVERVFLISDIRFVIVVDVFVVIVFVVIVFAFINALALA